MHLKKFITNNALNIPGFRTRRKIVVFESDDWGSIRMSSVKAYNDLLKTGTPLDKDPYSRFDSLESAADLEALFAVLRKHRDSNGNAAIITANTIVANPDFEKIRNSDFREYYFENFTETLKRYYSTSNVVEVLKQGITDSVFKPQFHGREHLNIRMWLNELQSGNKFLLSAFDHQVFGIPIPSNSCKTRNNFMAAFDQQQPNEFEDLKNIVSDGLKIFLDIFNFKSKSIIFPCYIWPIAIEDVIKKEGVDIIQGIGFQFIPPYNPQHSKRVFHYTGQKNSNGQRYLVRNAYFEPSIVPNEDTVGVCLSRINTAFRWGKPAIIGSHRLNFIGSLDQKNRDNNLEMMDDLLFKITSKWPEVEFMTSDELGNLIITD